MQNKQQSTVARPVIVFGTGRSGTTIFHDVLARHENLAYLSSLCHTRPDKPFYNRMLMQLLDVPVLGGKLARRFKPSEAYPLWERSCRGFSNPCRDLMAGDVTPPSVRRIHSALARMITPARRRLLIKITGWPRVMYLREIFPDARFVHVSRDPYAVVSSLLETKWWDGWRGPSSWRRGPLPPDLEAIWNDHGQSFAALAAIEYLLFERAFGACAVGDQLHEVAYSRLCADPVGTYRDVVRFCDLPWSIRFEREVRKFSLLDKDYKWRENLTPQQQEIVTDTLRRGRQQNAAIVAARAG